MNCLLYIYHNYLDRLHRPKSDSAEYAIWSGSALFVIQIAQFLYTKRYANGLVKILVEAW